MKLQNSKVLNGGGGVGEAEKSRFERFDFRYSGENLRKSNILRLVPYRRSETVVIRVPYSPGKLKVGFRSVRSSVEHHFVEAIILNHGGRGRERVSSEMTAVGGTSGGEEVATVSPRSRVKFLCSHGGKILPRPSDGQLKYVGGETRVVVIPRNISFSELMKKLAAVAEGEVVLRYQLIPEDLDVLVSVTCDEDLNHMLDEYDRHETRLSEGGGSPRLRAFLFPSHPLVIENQMHINSVENNALEQRYVDAINGVVRSPNSNIRHSFNGISRPTVSSAGSSPRSITIDGVTIEGLIPNNHHNCRMNEMHRVSSSPSLSSLAQQKHPSHQTQQHTRPYNCSPSRLNCPNSNGYGYGYGHGRLVTAISSGRSDFRRSQMGHVPPRYFSPTRWSSGKSGCSYGPMDEGGSIYRSGELEEEETQLQHSFMKQT